MRRAHVCLLITAVLGVALACDDGDETAPEATAQHSATAPVSPAPATTSTPEPAQPLLYLEPFPPFVLGDPAFEALPGAKAHFGRHGGSIYQIEMPDRWNGRLVLYLHGSRGQDPTLTVEAPPIRSYLIRNGYAWGASSFSRNDAAVFLGADETASLWDLFVARFARPSRTYVMGQSMGGGGAAIAADRFPDRFDGALGLCGIAGSVTNTEYFGTFFVAGAYVAGVTQSEFESVPAHELVTGRILPALEDPASRHRFERLVIDLTGGPRPFDHAGLALWEAWTWNLIPGVLGGGLFDNRATDYRVGTYGGVSSEDLNGAAVRVGAQPTQGQFPRDVVLAVTETTGNLRVPLLTLHTTGDMNAPLWNEQVLRRRVEAAGKRELLVQRTVRDPGHCTFTSAEVQDAFEALIGWVERDERPAGEDLLSGDLSQAGQFTLAPRFGSPEADEVPGAGERVTLSGTVTLNGVPVNDGSVWAVVRKDGLQRYCSFGSGVRAGGAYEIVVAGAGEAEGCGSAGAEIFLDVYSPSLGQPFWSRNLITWPAGPTELRFDAAVESPGSYRPNTAFRGAVLDSSGESLPPGTVIEAYIGATLCGISSLPPTVMALGDPSSYFITVMGPQAISGCAAGRAISFRVDGRPADQTGVNDFDGQFLGRHLVDLTVQ